MSSRNTATQCFQTLCNNQLNTSFGQAKKLLQVYRQMCLGNIE